MCKSNAWSPFSQTEILSFLFLFSDTGWQINNTQEIKKQARKTVARRSANRDGTETTSSPRQRGPGVTENRKEILGDPLTEIGICSLLKKAKGKYMRFYCVVNSLNPPPPSQMLMHFIFVPIKIWRGGKIVHCG